MNYMICYYSCKHNYFVSLSLLGVDGNVTQGTVSRTQCGGGQHLNTHIHLTHTESLGGTKTLQVHLLGLSVADQS